MSEKQAVFDNIEQYEVEDIVKVIKKGVVTFDELCRVPNGYFIGDIRSEVKKRLENSEDDDWENAKSSGSIEFLTKYLTIYVDGKYRNEARRLISKLKEDEREAGTKHEWDTIDKNNKEQLQKFIKEFPISPYCKVARTRINELQIEDFINIGIESLIKKINEAETDQNVIDPYEEKFNIISDYLDRDKISLNDLLNAIQDDNNLLEPILLNKLINEGFISYEDLKNIGIDTKFIQHLANSKTTVKFLIPKKLEMINKQSTEVYFWGITSSGKTCALGSILSVASNGSVAVSMSKNRDCQGYGYMHRLSELFKSDGSVVTLPEGTSIYSTYEMGFDLEDSKGLLHPITCIDLAGELVRCMYKFDAKEPLSDDEVDSLDTLRNILIDNRTGNRKIHFFVIEYGGENRVYEGLTQSSYLDAALQYIESTQIFEKDTDAIYVMITKVDKAKVKGAALQAELKNYIETNYQGFYNGIKRICRKFEINDGNVEIIPFSLGKVCFQDYCMFKDAPARNVVEKLLTRTKGFKNSNFQKGLNWFKK